jgi:hypothetical protein
MDLDGFSGANNDIAFWHLEVIVSGRLSAREMNWITHNFASVLHSHNFQ